MKSPNSTMIESDVRARECRGDPRRSVINTGCSTLEASTPSWMNAQSSACSCRIDAYQL